MRGTPTYTPRYDTWSPAFLSTMAVHQSAMPINKQRFCDWLIENDARLVNLGRSYMADCTRRGIAFDPLWALDIFEREVGLVTHWRQIPTLRGAS